MLLTIILLAIFIFLVIRILKQFNLSKFKEPDFIIKLILLVITGYYLITV